MAAKRKPLPRPCPKCGKHYGTMQITIFANDWKENVTCRIGHYDAEGYKKIKKINKINQITEIRQVNEKNSDKIFQKALRKKQRKWCSFRMDKEFAESILPLTEDFEYLENRRYIKPFRKSITYSSISLLKDMIKKKGWHMLSNYSDKYRFGKYVRNQRKIQEIIFQP